MIGLADRQRPSIDRRLLLQGLAGIALLPDLDSARAAAPARGTLDWQEFLDQIRPEALRLARDLGFSPESYVRRLSSEVLRVREVPGTDLQPVAWMAPLMHFGMLSMGRPFAVVEWRMEPGARQPCHNHPNGSVCTLLLEGELLLENFDLAANSGPATDRSIRLRRTRSERLFPGRTSVLTPEENNFHRLTAGSNGARGIDLNTVHGPTQPFSYVSFASEPDEDGFLEGAWYDPSSTVR